MKKKVMPGKLGSYATDARLFQKVESIPGEQALYETAEKEVRAELDRLRRPATVIDFCCGTCEILSRIAPHPKIGRFVGVDKEKDYLDFAKNRLKGTGEIELVLDDAVDCELGANADIIIASSAYHHIENERKMRFLRNIIRHMKPDARVVFAENILPTYKDENERTIAAQLFYGKRIEEARGMGMDEDVIALLRQVMDFEVRREYEWKVDYDRFVQDLERAGFEILRKTMVWPTGFRFADPMAGDYVLVAELPAWYL
jgi:SAM-dependent methyltransferase